MANGLAKSIEPIFAKIEQLSRVQRVAISAVTFALIAGGFIYFSYWPRFEKINRLNTELEKLEKQLKTAKNNAKDLEKFQAKIRAAEAQFQTAMKKLPEKEEIPSLLSSISNSGQQVGLEFLLFEPKPEKKKEFYAEIPVAMSIKGDYHNLALFFDQVARLSRIVNIQDIQIDTAKGKDNRDLNARCIAVTYKFIDTPVKTTTAKKDVKKNVKKNAKKTKKKR